MYELIKYKIEMQQMKEMKKVMQSIFIQAAKQPIKYFQIESRWLNISRLG